MPGIVEQDVLCVWLLVIVNLILFFVYPNACPYKNEIIWMGDGINLDPMIKLSGILTK